MAKELAFVLINPYTIRKSRTGGVIARYLGRTDLKLAAARLFGPSRALADEFAAYARTALPSDPEMAGLIADYIARNYAPDSSAGRPHRVLCLLFEGEDAVRQIAVVTGSARLRWGSGQTIRDTYGDFVTAPDGSVTYFEPAVLIGPAPEDVEATLHIWARHLAADSGIVRGALDIPGGEGVEQTLVLLKPDNFQFPSLRAGNILDLLSSTGLRMVGVKKLALSVSQAEELYAPVREQLRLSFPAFGIGRATQALSREFGFAVGAEAVQPLCEQLAPRFAEREFENIVEFMSGRRPSQCPPELKSQPGTVECLAILYEGPDAVRKIRDLLGSTDPNKARPGSVRREFGTNILVNAAHASDSIENARREARIVDVENGDAFEAIIRRYYP
jgi:nucleoside diphosphate kinase